MISQIDRDSQTGRFRIFLVDDHPLVRMGIAELLAHEPDLEICGEASDSPEALQKIVALTPDLAIIDLSLKSGHGIELIERVRSHGDHVRILVASMHDESLFAERALRAGAMGYFNKQECSTRLLDAVRQVLRGEIYLSPYMANRILHAVANGDPIDHDPIKNLSNRELEVFELIGQGLATKQIAGRLHLSPKTVETHREKIKSKLNLANSNELGRRAVQWVLECH